MTYQDDCTLPVEFLEQLTREGLEGLSELVRVLVNEAMRIERQNCPGARPYERSARRRGRANGYIVPILAQAEDRQDASGRNPLRHSPGA